MKEITSNLGIKNNIVYKDMTALLDNLRMILFVIILGAISAALLVFINFYTSQKVLKNEELEIKSSVMKAFDISYSKGDIEKVYDVNVKVITKSSITFYQSKDNDIAFMFNGPGFWGPITGVIALDSQFEAIKGIQIIHQEETPGLGARIAESAFLTTFKGKKAVPALEILPSSVKSSKENEVDGIAGATMTGKALESILNSQIIKYKEIWGK